MGSVFYKTEPRIRDDSYVASSWLAVLSVNDSFYLTSCVRLSLKTVELIIARSWQGKRDTEIKLSLSG